MALSKSQLDKLGDRLRNADIPTAEDVALYHEYRTSHDPALAEIQASISISVGLDSSGRLKTLESAILKLRRQHIRLSQIADIAGCRTVVRDLNEQEDALRAFRKTFAGCGVHDYREAAQHGYRAVHIIAATSAGHPVEIQLRTQVQDRWANLSEAWASHVDPTLKYGGGPRDIHDLLIQASSFALDVDNSLRNVMNSRAKISRKRAARRRRLLPDKLPARFREIDDAIAEVERVWRDSVSMFDEMAGRLAGEEDDESILD